MTDPTAAPRPASPADGAAAIHIANAPVSFGVDELLPDDAWMPQPDEVIDLIAELDYAGTELGPPGFLGEPSAVRSRLAERKLELVGSFLPVNFSDEARCEDDLRWLREVLPTVRESAPDPTSVMAILSDGFEAPERLEFAGRIPEHPEARLSEDRWPVLMANLHRAAQICRDAGFRVSIHPHAGTYLETEAEIRRMMDGLDTSLLGLCLDTGHVRFGGGDPVALARDYAGQIVHVHLKDCSARVLRDVAATGGGMEEQLRAGAFVDLGEGDSHIADVIEVLRGRGYAGWMVVEQDVRLLGTDTVDRLRTSQRKNRAFLRNLGL
ncbi:MAG TPA: TIM barrel protein [Candidatus Limnocylindrales bacterium]|nr:TIM barrel protein [Candidatus Limnocylindrales bacterium]